MAYSAFSGLNAGNAGIKQTIRQAHDFAIGDVVRLSGSTYVKAQANSSENAEVVGVVESQSPNQFTVVFAGEINFGTGYGFAANGKPYFLSDSTAGAVSLTPPLSTGTIKKTVYIGSGNGRGIIVNYLGMKNGFEGGDQVSLTGVSPVGHIVPYAGVITEDSQIPDGWLLCDGGIFNSAEYPELAVVLGETYGPSSGTTYTLPDLRGRTPIGVNQNNNAMDISASVTTPRVLGSNSTPYGGEERHALSTNELPSHTHPGSTYLLFKDEMANSPSNTDASVVYPDRYYGPFADSTAADAAVKSTSLPSTSSFFPIDQTAPIASDDWPSWSVGGDDSDYALINNPISVSPQGGGQEHNNMQPFIITNWLIRANSKVAAAILTVNMRGLADVDEPKEMTNSSGSVMMWGAANDFSDPRNAKGGGDKFIVNQTTDVGRNAIINGNFDFWQRGTSFAINSSSSAGNWRYLADRWGHAQSAGYPVSGSMIRGSIISEAHPFSLGKTNCPGTHTLVYRNDAAVSSGQLATQDYNLIGQLIEGFDYASLWSAGHITLSFLVKAKVAGNYTVAFRNGTYNRSYVAGYTVNQADTWEWKNITLPLDTANPNSWNFSDGVGIRVEWSIGQSGSAKVAPSGNAWLSGSYQTLATTTNLAGTASGTSALFSLAQVQLEAGKIATTFQHQRAADELKKCQRFYQKSYNLETIPGTATTVGRRHEDDWVISNVAHFNCGFETRMRKTPAVGIYNPSTGAVNQFRMTHSTGGTNTTHTVSSVTRSESNISAITRTGGSTLNSGYQNKINFHYTADAELSTTEP